MCLWDDGCLWVVRNQRKCWLDSVFFFFLTILEHLGDEQTRKRDTTLTHARTHTQTPRYMSHIRVPAAGVSGLVALETEFPSSRLSPVALGDVQARSPGGAGGQQQKQTGQGGFSRALGRPHAGAGSAPSCRAAAAPKHVQSPRRPQPPAREGRGAESSCWHPSYIWKARARGPSILSSLGTVTRALPRLRM